MTSSVDFTVMCHVPGCIRERKWGHRGRHLEYCTLHAETGMFYKNSKQCFCGQLGYRQYDWLCRNCYSEKHPEIDWWKEPVSPRVLSLSHVIQTFFPDEVLHIGEAIGDMRIDIHIKKSTHFIAIMYDENQHFRRRKTDVQQEMALGKSSKLPVYLIRFNADPYKNGDGFYVNGTVPPHNECTLFIPDTWERRLVRLIDTIRHCIEEPSGNPLRRLRLFYNGFDNYNGDSDVKFNKHEK